MPAVAFASSLLAAPDGTSLHVARCGAGPPLIFLHGFPDCHHAFIPMMEQLAGRHLCIAFDQRGHGRSGTPQDAVAYRMERLMGDVLAVADHFGLTTFGLVGHDWGGLVGWSLAGHHSQRVHRLIIFNAPHPWCLQQAMVRDARQQERSAYVRRFRDPGAARRLTAMTPDQQWAMFFGNEAETIRPTHRNALLESWARPGAWQAMLNWYCADGPDPQATGPFGEAVAVPQPALLLWGEQDGLFAPAALEGLDAIAPRLTIRRHPQGGHSLLRQFPDWSVTRVRDFLVMPPDTEA
jgi:pimeloyl-ACP methyl ester carboxylesterase